MKFYNSFIVRFFAVAAVAAALLGAVSCDDEGPIEPENQEQPEQDKP